MAEKLSRGSDAEIRKLDPSPARLVGIPGGSGLFIRINAKGRKSFTVVARDPWGKQKWRELPHAVPGEDKLDDVRPIAREAIRRIKEGQDPFPPPAAKPDTFGEVVKDWLKRHVERKQLRSRHEIERLLNAHVLPVWKDRDFVDIRKSDVAKLLREVEEQHGLRQSEYVLALVRGIMNWKSDELDDYVPPITRRRKGQGPAGRKRKRTLGDDEVRLIWPLLDGTFGAFLKVALYTAQRREKVASMRWADISEDGVWTIAAEDRQKGTAVALALPEAALRVIRAQPQLEGNAYVFAGRGENHFVGYSPCKRALDAKILKKLTAADPKAKPLERWTIHDMRRTARTLMARAGVDSEHAERVMGHAIDGVEGVYDRWSYFDEKKAALGKLAQQIEFILNPPGGNVVPLHAA